MTFLLSFFFLSYFRFRRKRFCFHVRGTVSFYHVTSWTTHQKQPRDEHRALVAIRFYSPGIKTIHYFKKTGTFKNSFQRQHQKLKRKEKKQQLIIGFSARVELPRLESRRSGSAQPPAHAAAVLAFPACARRQRAVLSPAVEKLTLSLVLNGVCVGLPLCMVLCLIILHHFHPIQSYLM